MKKTIIFCLIALLCRNLKAQFNFSPITQLITDSISVIGQAGQNCGFMIVRGNSVIYQQYWGNWNNTTYQPIASGSKMPSMALIMKLIDEGYLSPNDTVKTFFQASVASPSLLFIT